MAATILWSLGRIRLFAASRPAVSGCCGLRSRPPFIPASEDEDNLENEENEEQEIMRTLKRQEKAIRFKKIKRLMEPPEEPERRLTWSAMEQIRYLKQELPEEWTVERLADGFNVSTDVIRRVLKSKFVPSEARKMKQDAAVSRHLGPVSSRTRQDQLKLPFSKHPTQQFLDGNNDKLLLVSQSPLLLPSPKTSDSHIAVRTESTQRHLANIPEPQSILQKVPEVPPSPALRKETSNGQGEPVPSVPEEETDELWDGEILTDGELEEIAKCALENKMKVVQKGREFFDGDGNFLYKI
ncbi:neugrin [Mantella aurantiaca]